MTIPTAASVCASSLVLAAALLAQPAAPPDEAAVGARFAAGQQALQAGRFAAAEAEFRHATELMPELAEGRANLGLALFLQGKYEAAAAEFELVARQRPDLPTAPLFLGLSYLKLGSPSQAIPYLERSQREDPGNEEAGRALAACYLAEGDYAAAITQFQALFARADDKVAAWFRLGRDYMNAMSELAGQLVIGQPDSVWAARLGADMLGLSQAWEAAIEYYQTALEKRPDLPGLHAALGLARLHRGEWGGAEADFRAELAVDPLSERAWLGLVEVSLARGDVPAALDSVARVWESFPAWLRNPVGFPARPLPPAVARRLLERLPSAGGGPARFLGWVLHDLAGDPENARLQRSLLERELQAVARPEQASASAEALCRSHRYAACARALEARPALGLQERLTWGKALFFLGRFDPAAVAFARARSEATAPEATYWTVRTLQILADRCFQRVEELAPDSWRVHQLRAEVHQQRQDDEAAVAAYRRAIELKPDEAELHRDLGLLHLLDNAYEEAGQALERALELDRSNPRTLYFVGRLFVATQRHADAIPFLEGALRIDPNLIEARPSLGRAYLRAERFEEAAAELEQALALDYYGDIHYSLFQAQRRLGNLEAAKQALERSTAMRKTTFARDRGKFDRWIKSE